MNRHFSKKDMQIVNKHMKICSTALAITKIQIKITMTYHFTTTGMATKETDNKCSQRKTWRIWNPHTLLVGM